jgi:hypothetical protein
MNLCFTATALSYKVTAESALLPSRIHPNSALFQNFLWSAPRSEAENYLVPLLVYKYCMYREVVRGIASPVTRMSPSQSGLAGTH